jgi:hypothetical protein
MKPRPGTVWLDSLDDIEYLFVLTFVLMGLT